MLEKLWRGELDREVEAKAEAFAKALEVMDKARSNFDRQLAAGAPEEEKVA